MPNSCNNSIKVCFESIRSLFDQNSIIFCLLKEVLDWKIYFEYFGDFLCVFGLLVNFGMFGVLEILIDFGISNVFWDFERLWDFGHVWNFGSF